MTAARERLLKLSRAVTDEQRERVIAPLVRRLIELGREGGSVCAELEHRYLTLDDARMEITRCADELGIPDPFAGVPMPSEAMAERLAEASARAGEASIAEYQRQQAINRSK